MGKGEYVKLVEEALSTKKNEALTLIKHSPHKDMVNLLHSDDSLRKHFKGFVLKIREDKGNDSYRDFCLLVASISLAINGIET